MQEKINLKFGVPCSRLKGKIEDADINCSCEEQAMAIAAGCILAGKEPTVYMQNSGLSRCVDIITSLYMPYEIPLPKLILSIRHKPYHHSFIGNITYTLLLKLGYIDKEMEVIEE